MDKNHRPLWKNADFFVALCMLALSVLVLQQTFGIRVRDSRYLPFLIFSICFTSGSTLFCNVLCGKAFREVRAGIPHVREVELFVVLLIASLLAEKLGFYAALFLAMFVCTTIVFSPHDGKGVVMCLVYDGALTLVCYLMFHVCLGMVTPVGVLV